MTDVPHEYLDLVRDYRRESKRHKSDRSQKDSSDHRRTGISASSSRVERPIESPALVESEPVITPQESESEEDWEDINIEQESELPHEQGDNVTVSFQAPERPKATRGLPPREVRIEMHLIGLIFWVLWGSISSRKLRLYHGKFKHWLPLAIEQEIHPPSHLTTFLKSKKLRDGLRHAGSVWLNRCGADMMDIQCQVKWCAMLRAQRLEARLIVSLQPPLLNTVNMATKRTPARRSPLIWAEVWDADARLWVTADPVTETFEHITGKSTLEPAQSDQDNIMRYVFAFDSNGFARDVTRRYASQFNARTRKRRIEHVNSHLYGWYNELLGLFSNPKFDTRDIEELKELQRRTLREGMPRRVQDFVGHPVYVLESNLHKNQILRPNSQSCGRLAVKNGPSVPIYHREDVLTCRSGIQWFRRGLQLREGVIPRLHSRPASDEEPSALYSEDQTEVYVPPPVGDDGTIPKSQYRTIDIFAPTMVPRGAVHLRLNRAREAAKIIQVDYANAVTRLDWSRHGPKSHYDGIVVAQQYEPAIAAVCEGLTVLETEEAEYREEMRLLLLWRKFIIGIQIWERIERMNPDPDPDIARIDRWEEESFSPAGNGAWEPQDSESDEVESEEVGNRIDQPSTSFWEPQPSESEDDPEVIADAANPPKHLKERSDSPHMPVSLPEKTPRAVNNSESEVSLDPNVKWRAADDRNEDNDNSGSDSDFPDIIMDEISESEL